MEGVEEERSTVRGKSVNDNLGSGERRGGFRRRERVVSGGGKERLVVERKLDGGEGDEDARRASGGERGR